MPQHHWELMGSLRPRCCPFSLFPKPSYITGRRIRSTLYWPMCNIAVPAPGGCDILSNPFDRAKLVKFLESIDASTPPIQ